MTTELVITRPVELFARFRAYQIVLDGTEAGRIRVGETLRLRLERGRHTLEARIDWASSHPLILDVRPEQRQILVESRASSLVKASLGSMIPGGDAKVLELSLEDK